jgi:hypothetical protein
VLASTLLAMRLNMTTWEKPSFEELSMNAEIGAYQPDEWEGERQQDPFSTNSSERTIGSCLVGATAVDDG